MAAVSATVAVVHGAAGAGAAVTGRRTQGAWGADERFCPIYMSRTCQNVRSSRTEFPKPAPPLPDPHTPRRRHSQAWLGNVIAAKRVAVSCRATRVVGCTSSYTSPVNSYAEREIIQSQSVKRHRGATGAGEADTAGRLLSTATRTQNGRARITTLLGGCAYRCTCLGWSGSAPSRPSY